MFLPMVFHGLVGGTKEAYGHDLGMESMSGSSSSVMIWRRSLEGRRVGRACEDEEGGGRPRCFTFAGEGEGVVARILTRVGVGADDLHFMGADRDDVAVRLGRSGGGWGSNARKMSRARVPPSTERMCAGPRGDDLNCTTEFVV